MFKLHLFHIALIYFGTFVRGVAAFTSSFQGRSPSFTTATASSSRGKKFSTSLLAEGKFAKEVTGEELEIMLTEWDQPLLLDAYATWCGPCLLMAPHFEEAAEEMNGKVRFVKLDTDKEPEMAARLNIMGLPTLMFLDEYKPEDGAESGGPSAALKNKIEGALTKQSIIELCNYHFFDGPMPTGFGN